MKVACTELSDWPAGQQRWLEAAYRKQEPGKELDENI